MLKKATFSVLTSPTTQFEQIFNEIGYKTLAVVDNILQKPGNTEGGSITVLLTSCLTGLESAVCQLTIFVFICKTG